MAPTQQILTLGDITQISADAIVNAANNKLSGGFGVDGAIHQAAGFDLYLACQKIGYCATGNAVMTPGFNLPSKYVIHTVGPRWLGPDQDKKGLLASCYQNSLKLAATHHCRTIAFPSISTGFYGFPISQAAPIALNTIDTYVHQHPRHYQQIILVLYTQPDFDTYRRHAGPTWITN